MLNFKNAWLALIGQLPEKVTVEKLIEKEIPVEVVKEAIGKASAVMLYQFRRPTGKTIPCEYKRKMYREWRGYSGDMGRSRNPYEHYKDATEDEIETVACHSCEQAHQEANGAEVSAVPAVRVGSQFFLIAHVKPIKVLTKPRQHK